MRSRRLGRPIANYVLDRSGDVPVIRMLRHYKGMLDWIAKDPATRSVLDLDAPDIRDLPLVLPHEYTRPND